MSWIVNLVPVNCEHASSLRWVLFESCMNLYAKRITDSFSFRYQIQHLYISSVYSIMESPGSKHVTFVSQLVT